jgi:hypothetical protein
MHILFRITLEDQTLVSAMHYSVSNELNGRNDLERRQEMTRYWKYSAMILLALAVFVPAASARPRVFIGGYFGPGYWGPAYYGWYGPAYVAPYAVAPAPSVGKVKFDTRMKDAGVYVDGGYAGTVQQLGTFPLRPGDHDIELRSPSGQTIFQERVDVLVGKTIKLAA